jgi:hypothetical protein
VSQLESVCKLQCSVERNCEDLERLSPNLELCSASGECKSIQVVDCVGSEESVRPIWGEIGNWRANS